MQHLQSTKRGTEAPSKNKLDAKEARPAKSIGVVNSIAACNPDNWLSESQTATRHNFWYYINLTKNVEKLGNPAVGPSNHVVRNASGDLLKLEGELECQVCLGDRQIHTKCFITEQPDSVLMGLNWLDDAPESVTRINSKTKADPQPINTNNKRSSHKKESKSADTSLRNCHR